METLTSQIEDLKYQLAYSLAAIKIKNEELEAAHNGLRWWMDAFPMHVTEADNEEMLKLVKALAIQPGAEALEKWLGEPVAWRWTNTKGWLTYAECPHDILSSEPLYAKPKGVS